MKKVEKLMDSSDLQNSNPESKGSPQNVLGVPWDYKRDELMINYENIVEDNLVQHGVF